MDLSYALTWMIGIGALFGLWNSARELRFGVRGWFYKHLLILVVLGFGIQADWRGLGYLGLLLWAILIQLPAYARRRAQDAARRQRMSLAWRWASLACRVHPFDGYCEQARLLASQFFYDEGRIDEAKGVLYPLLKSRSSSELIKLELLRLDQRWNDVAEHARALPVGSRDLRLAPLYLRAFGEVGDLAAMWQMYSEVPSQVASEPALQLQIACYAGLVAEVDALLATHFPNLLSQYARLVRASALLAAGDVTEGEYLLTSLVRAGAPGAARAKLRLARPLRVADSAALPTHLQLVLANFRRKVRQESLVVPKVQVLRQAWVTLGLITTLVTVYLIGLPGGSTDPENLVRLGALVLPGELAEGGIAWRIVAAGFLHLGATHLLMNCLGLWVLGKQIERLWNGVITLTIFLSSSLGSFAYAALFVHATVSDPRIFLGASSGVMGLVGALATYLATGYLRHRREALGRRFLLVLAVVGAQLVFDAYTPIVSSMLHLTGLSIGALVAIPFSLSTWKRVATRSGAERSNQ